MCKAKYTSHKETDPPMTTPKLPEFVNLDLSSWPAVTVRIVSPPVQNSDLDAFQSHFIKLLTLARDGSARVPKGRLALIMCLDGIVEATPWQKGRAVNFIKEVRPFVADSIAATALVTSSTAAQSVLSFILGLAPLQSVNKVFHDEASARSWLVDTVPGLEASLFENSVAE